MSYKVATLSKISVYEYNLQLLKFIKSRHGAVTDKSVKTDLDDVQMSKTEIKLEKRQFLFNSDLDINFESC